MRAPQTFRGFRNSAVFVTSFISQVLGFARFRGYGYAANNNRWSTASWLDLNITQLLKSKSPTLKKKKIQGFDSSECYALFISFSFFEAQATAVTFNSGRSVISPRSLTSADHGNSILSAWWGCYLTSTRRPRHTEPWWQASASLMCVNEVSLKGKA